MLYKGFIAMGVLLLSVYSYAQYQGWSVWGVSEARHGASSTGGHGGSTGRNIYHK